MNINIRNGDVIDELKAIPDESVDCMVTDPPYGISFMNKDWDKAVPDVAIWKECLRVMKSGAFAFVMCSPRSDVQAEMVIKLKEAGFEVNYSPVYWVYASGFPKAMNVSKAVDRKLGYERTKIRVNAEHVRNPKSIGGGHGIEGGDRPWMKKALEVGYHERDSNISISEEAKRLDGSYAGFQPKPAVEVIIVAMKPLSEKTYVDQSLKNGKGITWLDDGRIPVVDEPVIFTNRKVTYNNFADRVGGNAGYKLPGILASANPSGRFPANLLVQDNVLDIDQTNKARSFITKENESKGSGFSLTFEHAVGSLRGYDDSGDLSRYFSLDAWYSKNIEELPDYIQRIYPFLYVPKASKGEREKNLDNLPETSSINGDKWTDMDRRENNKPTLRRNFHPTVKPIKLMTYLITIGSRPGDTILDPFMGSGTTGVASKIIHRDFIGFEIEGKYFEIAKRRIEKRVATRDIFEFDAVKEMEYEEK